MFPNWFICFLLGHLVSLAQQNAIIPNTTNAINSRDTDINAGAIYSNETNPIDSDSLAKDRNDVNIDATESADSNTNTNTSNSVNVTTTHTNSTEKEQHIGKRCY